MVSGGRTTESTWLAPDELGHANKGYKINFKLPKAFSDNSLIFSEYIPRVEEEPLKMLRDIAASGPAKIQVYENNQPSLLLRSPARSTSILVPTLSEVKADEAIFGSQNDLYKNAKKHINSGGGMSSKMSPHTIRHSVVCARISANVRKVNTMLHVISKANENSLMADKYDLSSDDSDEEAEDDHDKQYHYHGSGAMPHSSSRPASAFIGNSPSYLLLHIPSTPLLTYYEYYLYPLLSLTMTYFKYSPSPYSPIYIFFFYYHTPPFVTTIIPIVTPLYSSPLNSTLGFRFPLFFSFSPFFLLVPLFFPPLCCSRLCISWSYGT